MIKILYLLAGSAVLGVCAYRDRVAAYGLAAVAGVCAGGATVIIVLAVFR